MPVAVDITETQAEPPVASIVNRAGQSKIVLICEHASKHVPSAFGDLGLTEAAKISHAACDIGAQGLAEQLSATLDAVLVLNTMSRLIYDCNRAPIAPDAMPSQSEKIAVPGNRGLSNEQKLRRIKTVYEPFHSSVQAVLDSAGPEAVWSPCIVLPAFTTGGNAPLKSVLFIIRMTVLQNKWSTYPSGSRTIPFRSTNPTPNATASPICLNDTARRMR